jgi:cystathionine beta-synthase
MTTKVDAVQASDPLAHLVDVFAKNHAALVMDGPEFLGLITRIDLLNHLRRSIA